MNIEQLIHQLESKKAQYGFHLLYGTDPNTVSEQKQRYTKLIQNFNLTFPGDREVELFSTPGRTEVGGNHTDHNGGKVLAAAVDLDIIAAVSPNSEGIIRIQSENFPYVEINIADLTIHKSEQFTPIALVRGVCARLVELGYQIGGFDAFTASNVPNGAGLSSSAAFEVMIITILNTIYNNGIINDVLNAQIAQYAENEYFGKPCGLMDQTTCAMGGLIIIDFKDFGNPLVNKVDFDFSAQEFSIVIVETGGDHANLNEDYIALEHEMKATARAMGGEILSEFSKKHLLQEIKNLRANISDRGILRAIHFYDDDQRVSEQAAALEEGQFDQFLKLIIDSGASSWMLCQNIFSCTNVHEQGLAIALTMSENILKTKGAWRVHGGGFAGTIQAFVPNKSRNGFVQELESVFGSGSCHELHIRQVGTTSVSQLIN